MGPGSLTTGPGSLPTGPGRSPVRKGKGARLPPLSPLPPGETAYIRALMAKPGGLTPSDWPPVVTEYDRLCRLAQDRLTPPRGGVPPRLAALKLNRELAVDANLRWTAHHSRGHDTRHFRSTVAFNDDPDAIVCTSS
jgi:hypothetical protein